MYKYRTKNGEDTTITGVGTTVNGEIESEIYIENPNLELVEGQEPEANVMIGDEIVESAAINTDSGIVGATGPQPNAVTEATNIDPNQPNQESN